MDKTLGSGALGVTSSKLNLDTPLPLDLGGESGKSRKPSDSRRWVLAQASNRFSLRVDTTQKITPVKASASTSLILTGFAAWPEIVETWVMAEAESTIRLTPQCSGVMSLVVPAHASSSIHFFADTGLYLNHKFYVSARTGLVLSATDRCNTSYAVSANSTAVLSSSSVSRAKNVYASASTSIGLSSDLGSGDKDQVDSANLFYLDTSARATVTKAPTDPRASSVFIMKSRADAQVQLPSGATVPGGDSEQGLRTFLYSGVSEYPLSYAESSTGVLVAANGIDPMIRWNGMSPTASTAGVKAPESMVQISISGIGSITGSRVSYQRFIDSYGNVSDLSPIGYPVECGSSAVLSSASYDAHGYVTVSAPGHGLANGDVITIEGVAGMEINGTFSLVGVDADSFKLSGLTLDTGKIVGPGWWTKGAGTITYSVEAPSDGNVARRQILRNLDGDMSCFYVDVDTYDVTSVSFTSTRLDEELSAQEPVVLNYDDGMPAARRFGYPPSHKAVLANHLGRIFASVDRPYSLGHVEVSLGNQIVQGVGTSWVESMEGRSFYCEGATSPHTILGVVPGSQIMILDSGYSGPTDRFASYAIRPANIERRLVYYSEPNEPESWPSWNAFAVPETGDEIVGLMPMKSYLFIVEKRNIHSFTYKSDPGRDGFIFPRTNRGCVNGRCWVIVEGNAYMLDEAGVHVFDGDGSKAISSKIHNLFNDPSYPYRVDWSADPLLWHAVQDPVSEVIRWFIDFVGKESLTHALCYDYRRDRWWIEQYPERVCSSTLSTIGYRRVIAGTTGRRVIVLDEGTLDGVDAAITGVLSGTVLSATRTSVTIDATSSAFPVSLVGVPVAITSGQGRGQAAIIADSTSNTLTLVDELQIVPALGDTFQVGGISWDWRGGWLPYVDEERDNARDVGVVFKPTAFPGSFSFRLYYDYSDTPQDWGVSRSVDGISTILGSPDVTVDTQKVRGYAIQRMQSHRERYSLSNYFVSVELTGVQGVNPTRVFQLTLDGVYRESD